MNDSKQLGVGLEVNHLAGKTITWGGGTPGSGPFDPSVPAFGGNGSGGTAFGRTGRAATGAMLSSKNARWGGVPDGEVNSLGESIAHVIGWLETEFAAGRLGDRDKYDGKPTWLEVYDALQLKLQNWSSAVSVRRDGSLESPYWEDNPHSGYGDRRRVTLENGQSVLLQNIHGTAHPESEKADELPSPTKQAGWDGKPTGQESQQDLPSSPSTPSQPVVVKSAISAESTQTAQEVRWRVKSGKHIGDNLALRLVKLFDELGL